MKKIKQQNTSTIESHDDEKMDEDNSNEQIPNGNNGFENNTISSDESN